jgi:hypothetical protein
VDSMLSDVAWTLARLGILVGMPALIGWVLVARPSWREPLRLTCLVLVPCLITLWFMHDGGLGNGLNRLAYYMTTAGFFAIYAGLAAVTWLIQRSKNSARKLHCARCVSVAWPCSSGPQALRCSRASASSREARTGFLPQ